MAIQGAGQTSFVFNLNVTKIDYPPANIKKFWACNVRQDEDGNVSVSLRWNDVGAYLDTGTGKGVGGVRNAVFHTASCSWRKFVRTEAF